MHPCAIIVNQEENCEILKVAEMAFGQKWRFGQKWLLGQKWLFDKNNCFSAKILLSN